jgi:hypothetical protein
MGAPEHWFILTYDAKTKTFATTLPSDLPPRPADALPMEQGDPFTPWYARSGHLHVSDDGVVEGAHVRAEDFGYAVIKARRMMGEDVRGMEEEMLKKRKEDAEVQRAWREFQSAVA